MITWRLWLLFAWARRCGLSYHVCAQAESTGARAVLFADGDQIAHALALRFCHDHQQAAQAAAGAADVPDYPAEGAVH